LEKFSVLPQLGRFVFRDKGITVALGKITEFTDEVEAEEIGLTS